VIPVGSDHRQYADLIQDKLIKAGIRAEAKTEAETVSKKIREGQIQKIPYLLVVGEKEISAQSVSVRERKGGDIKVVKLEAFITKVKEEIKNRK
jgi:threonyl-tRNA synthetase